MIKKSFALLRTFVLAAFVPALALSLVACEPENGGDTGNGGEEDDTEDVTSEIAVTGLVDKFGCTYADISGYANLNLLPAGSGNPVIGVEVVEAKAESNENAVRSTSGSLIGNICTASFSDLSPATEYKYRSFVTYGGITYYGKLSALNSHIYEHSIAGLRIVHLKIIEYIDSPLQRIRGTFGFYMHPYLP